MTLVEEHLKVHVRMALLVYSGLKIISRSGYELLINLGIEKAKTFAEIIEDQKDFELISEPELNILTYRYIPEDVKTILDSSNEEDTYKINEFINKLTVSIQKEQRDAGSSFVSRTSLEPKILWTNYHSLPSCPCKSAYKNLSSLRNFRRAESDKPKLMINKSN